MRRRQPHGDGYVHTPHNRLGTSDAVRLHGSTTAMGYLAQVGPSGGIGKTVVLSRTRLATRSGCARKLDTDGTAPVVHDEGDVAQVERGGELLKVWSVVHLDHLEPGLVGAAETEAVYRDDRVPVGRPRSPS